MNKHKLSDSVHYRQEAPALQPLPVTGEGNAPRLDAEKDGPRTDAIRSLIQHAREDMRLAELTASEDSLWNLAEDCRNLVSQLTKLSFSRLEGE